LHCIPLAISHILPKAVVEVVAAFEQFGLNAVVHSAMHGGLLSGTKFPLNDPAV